MTEHNEQEDRMADAREAATRSLHQARQVADDITKLCEKAAAIPQKRQNIPIFTPNSKKE